jgi:multicomponent Na+:H+ antiporter subunit F
MSVKDVLVLLSFVLLGLSLLMGMLRFLKGPSVADRVIALDAVVLCAVGFLALLSLVWRSTVFLDLLLVVSLLGFLATVAFVNYLKEKSPSGGSEEEKGEKDEFGS